MHHFCRGIVGEVGEFLLIRTIDTTDKEREPKVAAERTMMVEAVPATAPPREAWQHPE